MQQHDFQGGGGVVHKLRLPGSKCLFSVWYDASGQYVDAERIETRGISYPVTTTQRRQIEKQLEYWRVYKLINRGQAA